MNRRDFIATTSLGTMATIAVPPGSISGSEVPLIDTHQHLWDLEMFPLKWVKPPLNRSFTMDDYLSATRGQNVVKAIYMEVGVPRELKEQEACWVLRLCSDPGNPTAGAVISADPADQGFASKMKKFEGNPHLKGIRYSMNFSGDTIPSKVLENVKLLGRLGLSMDMNLKPGHLLKGYKFAEKCPDVRFILDHCGNPDPVSFFTCSMDRPRIPDHDPDLWYRGMEKLAELPQITCKVSGMVDNVPGYPLKPVNLEPMVSHCYRTFGPDRLIFGGDWPVCLRNMTLGEWINLLKEVVRSWPETDRRKLFHDNASALYSL